MRQPQRLLSLLPPLWLLLPLLAGLGLPERPRTSPESSPAAATRREPPRGVGAEGRLDVPPVGLGGLTCASDADCDDGEPCTEDSCDVATGTCVFVSAPCEAGQCDDGVDNDADGDVDCFDPDCLGDPACCPVDPGTVQHAPQPVPCGQPVQLQSVGASGPGPLNFEFFELTPTGPAALGPPGPPNLIVDLAATTEVFVRVHAGTCFVDSPPTWVLVGAEPPVAEPGGPHEVCQGQPVVLDASASFDPDEACGDVLVEYRWDLDSDGLFDQVGPDPVLVLPPAAVGFLPLDVPNPIRLQVVDSTGLPSDPSDTTLTIFAFGPPVPLVAIDPQPAGCNQPVSFDASASEPACPLANIVDHRWDFDDSDGVDFGSPDAVGPVVTHSYAEFGLFVATLQIVDDLGGEAIVPLAVDVSAGNAPPVAVPGGPHELCAGEDLLVDASASFDPDAACGDSIVRYAWDVGADGTVEVDVATPTATIPAAALAGLPPGLPTPIQLTVFDEFDLPGVALTQVVLSDLAPVALFGATPASAGCGELVSFDGSASFHPCPSSSLVEYRWDFGDGSPEVIQVPPEAPVTTHAYAAPGLYTVTLLVTDEAGRTGAHALTVQVEDLLAPTALCHDLVVQLDASGAATILPSEVDDGSGDACGPVSLDVQPSSFGCAEVGPNSVLLTVTDAAGNSSDCTATVTVEDNLPPMPACQDVIVQLDATGHATLAPAEVDAGSSDACGIGTLALDRTEFTCADLGTQVVQLTVTDANGNSASCTALATVVDDEPPVLECPPDLVVECGQPEDPTATGFPTVEDNCDDDPELSWVDLVVPGSCPVVRTIERQWTASDDQGNSVACTQVIEVQDTTPPERVGGGAPEEFCVWPPNGKYACFAADEFALNFSDACDPSAPLDVRIVGCESDQPDPDGMDCVLVEDGRGVCVRAERDPGSDGRTYTITVAATDACGNESEPQEGGVIRVPKDGRQDDCRIPTEDDPPTTIPRGQCQALPHVWLPYRSIEAAFVCPPLGTRTVGRLELVDLFAEASDVDVLEIRCEKRDASGKVVCVGEQHHDAPETVELRWRIVAGPGTLKTDGAVAPGPAALYDPPNDLERPTTVLLECRADDLGAQAEDGANVGRIRLRIRPDPADCHRYIVRTDVVRQFRPPRGSKPPDVACACAPSGAWDPAGGLSGHIVHPRDGDRVCAGEKILLTALGLDQDSFLQHCEGGECGDDDRILLGIDDPLTYTWSVTDTDDRPVGRFPCGNVGRRVIWQAPTDAGEVLDAMPNLRIRLVVDDSGAQADEGPLPAVRPPRLVEATVVLIDELQFIREGDPDTHGDLFGDNPAANGGGHRFHPGARTFANRATGRNLVRALAVVKPAVAGLPIYFRAFDVDDPTANDGGRRPNDFLDINGCKGRDNRGRLNPALTLPTASTLRPDGDGYRGRLRSATAAGPGAGAFAAEDATIMVPTELVGDEAHARVELRTTFAPGDNFRIVASCKEENVTMLDDEDDVPPTNEPELAGFDGKLTRTLYVWRYLFLEDDLMVNVGTGGSVVAGTHAGVMPFAAGQSSLIFTRGGAGTAFEANQFDNDNTGGVRRGGRMDTGARSFFSPAHLALAGGAGSTMAAAVLHDGAGAPPGGGAAATFYDDDCWDAMAGATAGIVVNGARNIPLTNHGAAMGLMQEDVDWRVNLYADAYIHPRHGDLDAVDVTATVPALVNVAPWSVAAINAAVGASRDTMGMETDTFWIAYLTSAFQASVDRDNDPNSDGATGGVTPAVAGPGVQTGGDLLLVFEETIRDRSDIDRSNDAGIDRDLLAARVVAHEVGHQFGLDHEDENAAGTAATVTTGGAMRPTASVGAAAAGFRFTPAERRALRSRHRSPGN